MRFTPVLAFLLFLFLGTNALQNVHVKRKFEAESHVLRVDSEITIGDITSSEYIYLIDSSMFTHLAFISAKLGTSDLALNKPEVVNGHPAYSIKLPSMSTAKNLKIIVHTIFTGFIAPKPSHISQSDKQFVTFSANLLFLSPYETIRQETSIIFPKGEIYYDEKIKPVKKSGSVVNYGPFYDSPPFSKDYGSFNYENGFPFLHVTSLTRIIEVSHWGNIAVEEHFDISHKGAKLRGPFSRLDYQKGIGHHSSVSSFKTILPASARHIYYRDDIGNISTSSVNEKYDSVEIELQPRFPLFGGWKTHYTLGYNVPTHDYLFKKGNEFALRMRIMDHIFDDQVVDEMTIRIILPETVKDIKFETPYSVERMPDEVMKTYFDTSGRIVIVAKKKNLVEDHIKEFTVYYKFHMWNMAREPLMIITTFLLLFMVVILYVRLDFSFLKDENSDLQQRTQVIVDDIIVCQNKRSALYQSYEELILRYKSNKDFTNMNKEFRKVDADHKNITQKIIGLQQKLKVYWIAGAEKINELQQLDHRYRELVQESMQLAERVVTAKISKPQYQTADADASAKKVALIEKIDAIIESI